MKLFNYIRKYLWAYFIVLVMLIVNVGLNMFSPQLTKRIINDVLIGHDLAPLRGFLIGFIIIGVGRGIAVYTREVLADFSASGIATAIRRDLFHHTQKLSASYFDKNNAGETMSRIKSDVDKIWDSMFVVSLIGEVIFHVSMVLYNMFTMNWQMAILPTLMMISAGFVAIRMEKKMDKVYDEIDEEDSVLNDTASENLAGVRTVKSFNREKHEIAKFYKHNSKYYELCLKESRTLTTYWPIFQFMSLMIPIIVLVHGGINVMNGTMDLGELSAYIQYSTMMTWPMEMLGWLVNSIAYGTASWKRIKKLYNEESDIKDKEDCVKLEKVNGNISFENVKFEHNDQQILKGVTFDIGAGQTLGIMGATGSGKTTLINLLTRIYDVTDGSIKLDGVDIRDLSKSQLRSSVAPVTQDVFLFSNTIEENVKFGNRKNITDKEVTRALDKAEADFVWELQDKEKTVIGERGVGLSGGQKQRLTIARAVAKKRPIIVFDDSTSALDMETEKKLQHTINGIQNVTKIIIAHRISSVCHADKIIILDEGKVCEQGTHNELLEKKGLYYQTWVSQYGDFDAIKKLEIV